jgi:hypothetical protein
MLMDTFSEHGKMRWDEIVYCTGMVTMKYLPYVYSFQWYLSVERLGVTKQERGMVYYRWSWIKSVYQGWRTTPCHLSAGIEKLRNHMRGTGCEGERIRERLLRMCFYTHMHTYYVLINIYILVFSKQCTNHMRWRKMEMMLVATW